MTHKGGKNGVDQRQHGGRQRIEKTKRLDGRTGLRYKSQRLTELVGGIVLRPYVPHGTKKIGNRGEGSGSFQPSLWHVLSIAYQFLFRSI